jgi:ubiquinone/menaquinone biosynthesis C-methylase UbiE
VKTVDEFWNQVSIMDNFKKWKTEEESINFLDFRDSLYPFFRELTGLYGGEREGQVILDYGCGPGHDVIGFLHYTKAKKVIGIDISNKALSELEYRLTLHDFGKRIELIKISDSTINLPLKSESVDHINCQGVLHHISHLGEILSEFYRVLKPNTKSCVMVYNKESIFYHFHIAYMKVFKWGEFPVGTPTEEIFKKSTDGESCPISIPFSPKDFIKICETAGFKTDFIGGYLCKIVELEHFRIFGNEAIACPQLTDEHKNFLKSLEEDTRGYLYKEKYAGVGGVYHLYK